MQLFYWNELYETGIDTIDTQHHQLLTLINEMGFAFAEHQHLPEINNLLGRLFDYTLYHFSEEENLMANSGLSETEIERHKHQHQAFLNKLNTMSETGDLEDENVVARLLEFLGSWLITHILGTDKELAKSLMGTSEEPANVHKTQQELVEALRLGVTQFHQLADSAPVMIRVKHVNTDKMVFNKACQKVSNDVLVEEAQWLDRIDVEDRPRITSQLRKLSEDGQQCELEYRFKDSQLNWRDFFERSFIASYHKEGSEASNDTGKYLVSITADQTQLKEAELILSRLNSQVEQDIHQRTQEIKQLIMTDPATAVGNKRYILSLLEAEFAKSDRFNLPLGAMLINVRQLVDTTDPLNQSQTHIALTQFSKNISRSMRDVDHIGRISSSEFLVILPMTNLEKAEQVARRLLAAVSELNQEDVSWYVQATLVGAEKKLIETPKSMLERMRLALTINDTRDTSHSFYIMSE